MSIYLMLPIVVGLIYAFSSVFLKRSMEKGASPWTVLFLSSVFCGLFHLPFFFWAQTPAADAVWYQPFFAALTLFVGLVFTWLAIYSGDVSVANPVMGTKVIFVAFFTILLTGKPVPPVMWGASLLIAAALFLMRGKGGQKKSAFLKTVLLAAAASVNFAISDVLIQKYASYWGIGLFPPILVIGMALMSLTVLPWCIGNMKTLSRDTWKLLIWGSILTGIQMAGLVVSLTVLEHENSALLVNIMYNSRGIWTVLIILFGRKYLKTAESGRGTGTLVSRLTGSLLILTAIIIVFLKK